MRARDATSADPLRAPDAPIPFGKPMLGERERAAVASVLEGTTLTHGPLVREFEAAFAAYADAPHAVATASCMASLHLAYLCLGIGAGDDVLVPAQTHVAMAHAVELTGATPVFVDSDPRTGNVDLDLLESLVTPATRALSVVHYLGLPVDMERVTEIGRRRGLFVVEDCAIALGGRFQDTHVGLHGDVGCFSFYPVKHITTGEGGMLIANRADVAELVSKQRAFGIDKGVLADRRHTAAYDVDLVGLNYRMGEVAAALGVEQLRRLPDFLAARERNYERLSAGLSGLKQLEVVSSGHQDVRQSSHYCLSALLRPPLDARRDELIERLRAEGVGTSVYYPRPLPDTRYYRERYGHRGDGFPVAAALSYRSIAFPVGPHVGDADVDRMVEVTTRALAALEARA